MKYAFENLEVWNDSRKLISEIYKVSAAFPTEELYGITAQIRRAALSISLNIVEGSSRITKKDQANFYKIAYSSATEVLGALFIAVDLDFLNEEQFNTIRLKIEKITWAFAENRRSPPRRSQPRCLQ